MPKAYYNNYCINYSSNQTQERNKLLEFMKNVNIDYNKIFKKNIVLNSKNKDELDNNTQYIENIDNELSKIAIKLHDSINSYVDKNKELYTTLLYLESFLYSVDYRDKDTDIFIAKKRFTDEKTTYVGLGALYFTNMDEYKNFLINMDEKTKEKIRNHFSKDYQNVIFEKILKRFSHLLNETYPEVMKETKQYEQEIKKHLEETKKEYTEDNNSETTFFENNTTEELFIDFLKEIDSTGEWLKIYNDLRNDKKIQFLPYPVDNYKKTGVYNDKEIVIICENNCNDLIMLAHEFAHYISRRKDYDFNNLLEFPSIYYETKAQDFLIKKGISEKELINIRKRRENKLQEKFNFVLLIYDMISYLKTNTNISEYPHLKNMDEDKKKRFITRMMTKLVNNPESIYQRSSYPIGKYLSDKMIEKENSEEIMKNITENLQDYNITSILDIINNEKTL